MIELKDDMEGQEALYQVCECCGKVKYFWDIDFAHNEAIKYLSDKGILISNNDILIAGHAVSSESVLVTNNTKEFMRVPELIFEDWVQH